MVSTIEKAVICIIDTLPNNANLLLLISGTLINKHQSYSWTHATVFYLIPAIKAIFNIIDLYT